MTASPGALARLAPPIVVAAVALALRLWQPSPFVTWDEPNWTYRSLQFARALAQGRTEETYLSAHPGVPTMWAGAVGIAARASGGAPAGGWAWVDALPPYDEDDALLLGRLKEWWPAARTALAVLTAALIAAAYAPAARLTGRQAAFAACMLLAADPWLLGHSRVLHLDAVLALTLLLSVLCATVRAAGRGGRWWVVLGGVFAGVAVAEKSPALVVVPFVAALLLAPAARRSTAARRATSALADVALFAAAAAGAYVVLWPALWTAPLGTVAAMVSYARSAAGGPREAVFFAGSVTPDPGPLLYLAALAWRLTPLAILGLAAAVPALAREKPSRSAAAAMLAWSATFVVAMALGAKKFERYALPALVPLDVVAGIGLAWASGAFSRAASGRAAFGRAAAAAGPRPPAAARLGWAVLAAVTLAHAAAVARHAPYYLSVYNPLLGGGETAARTLPVGWGEGMDRAAAYLDGLPDSEGLTVATPSVAILAPLVRARVVPASEWRDADYVVLYVDDVQIGRPDLVARRDELGPPLFVSRVAGIDYAWVFAGPGRGP